MNAWRQRYASGRRRARCRGQLPDDVAVARREPERPRRRTGSGRRRWRSARRVAAPSAARRSRPVPSRRSRVSCLASSTFGWSNGSMPRTAPAIARRDLPADELGAEVDRVGQLDPDDRMAGGLERVGQRVARAAVGRRPARSGRTRGPGRTRSTAPSGSRSTGTIPTPCLPVLSAMSCSAHAPKLRDLVVGQEGQLVAAAVRQGRRWRARARRPGWSPDPARGRPRASPRPTPAARRGRSR